MIFRKSGVVVPFINPRLKLLDLYPLIRSIRSTWLVYGKHTEVLEQALKNYLGVNHVVATSSCTTALQLALKLGDVAPGDEVITTPMSWVSSTTAIIHHGAVPIFCDIDEMGLIDISKLEALISHKTKAILFVDLYGQMPNVIEMKKLADRYDLILIEDAAHALEAKFDGYSPGQISDFAAFSFHAAKNITSGQGGALSMSNSRLAKRAKILRRDGVINLENGKRRMVELGYKFDSTDFQSAMLLPQLRRIDSLRKKRSLIFKYYKDSIDTNNCKFPLQSDKSTHAFHLFVVLVNKDVRDDIRDYMKSKGVITSVHYEPIHLEPYFLDSYNNNYGNLQAAENFGGRVIALPTFPELSKRQMKYVVKTLNEALEIYK